MRKTEPGDKVDYGVLGMKWGHRRTPAQLAEAAAKRSAKKSSSSGSSGGGEEKKTSSSTSSGGGTSTPSGTETSASRYSRLAEAAKAGKGSQMSDADLKFFNARTEALSKVNKMAKNDAWLSNAMTKVLKTSAERSMQSVADAVASKYITVPITDAIKSNAKAIAAESKTPVDYVGKRRAKKN